MEENKLIDIDYFVANKTRIEEITNKKFLTAMSLLLRFHSGELLLNTRNTERITSATQNTVFAFNYALAKDISKSYDDLEEAIIISRFMFKHISIEK